MSSLAIRVDQRRGVSLGGSHCPSAWDLLISLLVLDFCQGFLLNTVQSVIIARVCDDSERFRPQEREVIELLSIRDEQPSSDARCRKSSEAHVCVSRDQSRAHDSKRTKERKGERPTDESAREVLSLRFIIGTCLELHYDFQPSS